MKFLLRFFVRRICAQKSYTKCAHFLLEFKKIHKISQYVAFFTLIFTSNSLIYRLMNRTHFLEQKKQHFCDIFCVFFVFFQNSRTFLCNFFVRRFCVQKTATKISRKKSYNESITHFRYYTINSRKRFYIMWRSNIIHNHIFIHII